MAISTSCLMKRRDTMTRWLENLTAHHGVRTQHELAYAKHIKAARAAVVLELQSRAAVNTVEPQENES